MAVGQNLRYLFCRDYHLFKKLLRVTWGYGVLTHNHMAMWVKNPWGAQVAGFPVTSRVF